jgi:hypothetical protein
MMRYVVGNGSLPRGVQMLPNPAARITKVLVALPTERFGRGAVAGLARISDIDDKS